MSVPDAESTATNSGEGLEPSGEGLEPSREGLEPSTSEVDGIFTARFTIPAGVPTDLISKACAARPHMFFDTIGPFRDVIRAWAKKEVLWIRVKGRASYQKIRGNPTPINKLFKDELGGKFLHLNNEPFVLQLTDFLPPFNPDNPEPSRSKIRKVANVFLHMARDHNKLHDPISRVVKQSSIWLAYFNDLDDAKALAREGQMLIGEQSRPYAQVRPFDVRGLFIYCLDCHAPGHMQGECQAEHKLCRNCGEQEHGPHDQCDRPQACANCKNADGRPMRDHSPWHLRCEFPATVKMRDNALKFRRRSPWWWDSKKNGKPKAVASQQSSKASGPDNEVPHPRRGKAARNGLRPSGQTWIHDHFRLVSQCNVASKESSNSDGSADNAGCEVRSSSTEDVFALEATPAAEGSGLGTPRFGTPVSSPVIAPMVLADLSTNTRYGTRSASKRKASKRKAVDALPSEPAGKKTALGERSQETS